MSKFNTGFGSSKQLLGAAVALAMGLASATASAVTVTNVPAGGATASVMADALLANNSGINIVGGSAAIQGANTASVRQFGTYSGFNLAPSTGTGPTLAMANGVVLTSGSATVPNSNTTGSFSTTTNSGANAQLTALAGRPTFDANTLGFDFTVAAGVKSVSAQFVFASEEFPDQAVTDIFGFFIDGVNYARFADGDLISNEPGSGNFVSNVNGAYGIEYDGLTNVLTVTGLLDELLSTHSLMFGVADTSDSIYDSAVYMNSLIAGQAGTGGLSNDVPEPGSAFLFAIAMAGAAAARRKKARK